MLVGEPTWEQAVAILRGLKDKYEVHHGVRITDGALVAAVKLSHRYIADRLLPDKAIDLMDEAASRLRMEIDSVPAEVDELQRRLNQLEMERLALEKENRQAAVERREADRRQIAELRRPVGPVKARWEQEKERIDRIRDLQGAGEPRARDGARRARRRSGPRRELKYGGSRHSRASSASVQELKRSRASTPLLREEVDEDDIAPLVAAWTGIPAQRWSRTRWHGCASWRTGSTRVVGQDEAVAQVARPSAARAPV